jgi:hypothetical protein
VYKIITKKAPATSQEAQSKSGIGGALNARLGTPAQGTRRAQGPKGFDAAEKAFETAVGLAADNPWALANLGVSLAVGKKFLARAWPRLAAPALGHKDAVSGPVQYGRAW